MATLESARLLLRPLGLDHAHHFTALFDGDWDAIRQTGRMPYPPTEAAVRDWIAGHLGAHNRVFLLVPAQAFVAQFLATFKEFPPRQEVGSFSLERVLEELKPGND